MRLLEFTSLKAKAGATKAAGTPPDPGKLAKTAQNILAHIPGEASGFYLMAVDAFETRPGKGTLAVISILSFAILLLVRWVAKASWAVMLTSIGAFVIWMLVLDQGFLHAVFPDLLPGPLGLIVAVFYSLVITTLANAGKIK